MPSILLKITRRLSSRRDKRAPQTRGDDRDLIALFNEARTPADRIYAARLAAGRRRG